MPATPRSVTLPLEHNLADLENKWFWEDELHQVEPPPWLIHETIPQRSVNMLFGDFNLGKTFLALDWAGSVATGLNWRGREVKQGDVLYIASEGDPGNLGLRMQAWREARGVTQDKIAVLFYAEPISFHMMPDLLEEARAHGLRPSLVIIDTLAMAMDDQENDNTAMNAAIKKLRSLQTYEADGKVYETSFLLVHHVGWGDDGRPRGASSMPGGLDNILGMRAVKDTSLIQVSMYKGKNMDKVGWGKMNFRLSPAADSVYLEFVSEDDVAKAQRESSGPGVGESLVLQYLLGMEAKEEFGQADIRRFHGFDGNTGKSNVAAGVQGLMKIGAIAPVPDKRYKYHVVVDRSYLLSLLGEEFGKANHD